MIDIHLMKCAVFFHTPFAYAVGGGPAGEAFVAFEASACLSLFMRVLFDAPEVFPFLGRVPESRRSLSSRHRKSMLS